MSETSKTLDKALLLLSEVAIREPIGLRELSRLTNMSPAVVSRFVQTFEKHGFIKKDENGKLTLGYELYYLGKMVESRQGFKKIIYDELKKLQQELNETIHLVERRGKHIVFTERFQSDHVLQYVPNIGQMYPLPYGATGKVFMAHMEKEEVEKILDEYQVEEREKIWSEIERVKQKGFAMSNQERFKGLIGYAFPIQDDTGVIHVINIVIPVFRYRKEDEAFLIEKVNQTRARIHRYVSM